MYSRKTVFFDDQSTADWARAEYTTKEMDKLERVFSHIGPLAGLTILEPGCGTGRLTEILSDRVGPGGRITAMDISPLMMAEARDRNANRSNVRLELASIESWPEPPDAFDLVFCHQVFPHFENKEKVLAKLARMNKKNGRLIVFHFVSSSEINDFHRKVGTAVEHDLLPGEKEMRLLFNKNGYKIEFITDDENGYFLSAFRE